MKTDYNPVTHLSSAVFPFDAKEKIMAFITGYFDESYTHSHPLVYTVAGYISTDEKWIEFQKEWQAILDRENLPHFSMKDFANINSRNFKHWTEARKVSFLQELLVILNKTYLRGFSASVIVDDYNALEDKYKFAFGKPHVIGFTKCLKLIEEWTNKINLQEPIHYVFEQGANDNKTLQRLYVELLNSKTRKRFRIDGFSFQPKKLTPLQAADILAYETRKDICHRYKENVPEMRKPLLSIIDWSRNSWFVADKNYFDWCISQPSFQAISEDEELKTRIEQAKKKGLI